MKMWTKSSRKGQDPEVGKKKKSNELITTVEGLD